MAINQAEQTELMLQVAKGNAVAFRRLSLNLNQRMFNLAYRLLGTHRSMAEDAVQEALVKLWRTAPNWRPDAPVTAYVSRLIYTCCMDIHRKMKPFDELPEELAAPDTILDEMVSKTQRQVLLTTVDKLPDRQRQAILLHYMGEHSQRDVASILGTTEKAVERLLARARINLRELLPISLKEGGYLS